MLAAAAASLACGLIVAATPVPSPTRAHRGPIGGPQLAGHGVIVNYPAHRARRLPHIHASAYVIADAGTGQVLAAKDPHGWYLPASTLKVLTAITLMPVLSQDATVVASRRAADVQPNRVGVIAGHSYKVGDLFKAMLMISANDAAVALAQATGSLRKGVAMMNAEARHLQANDTVAKRPNGLNEPGQHVSAYDEALWARQALALPEFMHDIQLHTMRFRLNPHKRPETLYTQNTMLWTYRGDLGGKIGWTTASQTTFIGWARRNGQTLIVTILHCTPLMEMTYAAQLLNWGFAMDGKVRPVGVLVRPLPTVTAVHSNSTTVHQPVRHKPRTRAPQATPAGLGVPMLAGLGALAFAALAGVTVAVIILRRRRAGNRPAS